MSTRARILLLDHEALAVAPLARALRDQGYEVRVGTDPATALEDLQAFAPAAVLLGLEPPRAGEPGLLEAIRARWPETRVAVLRSDGTAAAAVRAMKGGAADYLTRPFDAREVQQALAALAEQGRPHDEAAPPGGPVGAAPPREMVGCSPALRELQARADLLGDANVPVVLITGENGTGKEMLARHLHQRAQARSPGRELPYIGVNCAALPEQLIESELFGHERGAFTDARAERKGVLERAAGGTVVLDEIGDMRWDLQAKLLRVVEERCFRRVGGTQDLPLEATVYATTNRDLDEAVRGGRFRVDLFYRLATFSLHVPPLRERPEDVPPLARHFLARSCARYRRPAPMTLSPEAERLLVAHTWPGNVRELRNVMERVVVLEAGPAVLPGHLPDEIASPPPPAAGPAPGPSGPTPRWAHPDDPTPDQGVARHGFVLPEQGVAIEDLKSTLIVQALTRTGRNKAQAAKLLGISYDTLRYQLKRLGL